MTPTNPTPPRASSAERRHRHGRRASRRHALRHDGLHNEDVAHEHSDVNIRPADRFRDRPGRRRRCVRADRSRAVQGLREPGSGERSGAVAARRCRPGSCRRSRGCSTTNRRPQKPASDVPRLGWVDQARRRARADRRSEEAVAAARAAGSRRRAGRSVAGHAFAGPRRIVGRPRDPDPAPATVARRRRHRRRRRPHRRITSTPQP